MKRRVIGSILACLAAAGCGEASPSPFDPRIAEATLGLTAGGACPSGNGYFVLYYGSNPTTLTQIINTGPNFVILGGGQQSNSAMVNQFHAAGIKVFEYVPTGGSRTNVNALIATVLATGWDGIFFDQIDPTQNSYNANIAGLVHAQNRLVIMNPGQAVIASGSTIFSSADIVSSENWWDHSLSPNNVAPWRWLSVQGDNGGETGANKQPAGSNSVALQRLNTFRSLGGFWYYSAADRSFNPPSYLSQFASAVKGMAQPCPVVNATVTVRTVDQSGNSIPGLSVAQESTGGSVIATGFSPVSFQVAPGSYIFYPNNYGSNNFSHWSDGVTTQGRVFNITGNTTLTAVYDTVATVTVNAVDQSGNSIPGLSMALETTSGSVITSGFSPATFQVAPGSYIFYPNNYGSNNFSHWSDGVTTQGRVFNISGNTTLTAVYDTQVTVTVNAVSTTGAAIQGMQMSEETASGSLITAAFSPATFTVSPNTVYEYYPNDYGNTIFSHWSDGSTVRPRSFSFTTSTTLTAVYTQ
jgi:hypothetical protein